MPPEVPPEGVRYTWAFSVNGAQFQLQAKRLNLASITTAEDPVGHALQAANQRDFFQLRGACTNEYQGAPIAGCFHLAFLDGQFDVDGNRVVIDLPYETRDNIGRIVAAEFTPGSVLLESRSAGMSIAGAFQAVVSNTTVSNFINNWEPYYTAPVVDLAADRSSRNAAFVNYSTRAELAADGTWIGTVSGFGGANDTVFARACHGAVCAFAKLTP